MGEKIAAPAQTMEWAAFVLLFIVNALGFIAGLFNVFGNFIILIGAFLFSWMTGFEILTPPVLVLISALYLLGEILEYFLVILGTRKFGGSKASVWGAVLGGIAGAVLGSFLFGIGAFFGAFAGIFLGAFLMEWRIHKDFKRSVMAGAGGIFGQAGSIAAKLMIAIVIFIIEAVLIFKLH